MNYLSMSSLINRTMETTLSIIKNPETGKNELLTEYLFCDDLWREIKSFMLMPYTLHKGLTKITDGPDEVTDYEVLSYARKHKDIRGAKRLCRMMDNNLYCIFDKNGNCGIDGFNVELYNRFKREAQIEKDKNNKIHRQKIIDEYRPYHCATGGYFLYDGTWIPADNFSVWCGQRHQLIDEFNKEFFRGLIQAGLFEYFAIKH